MKTEIINATARNHEPEIRKATAIYLRKRGMSNSEIAKVLGVSYATIYNYLGAQPYHNFGGTFVPKKKNGRKPKNETESNVTTISSAQVFALISKVADLTNAVFELTRQLEIERKKEVI